MNNQNKLRLVRAIVQILGKEGLRNLGFDIPRSKVTAKQAIMLNRMKEELPSASDLAKADDIELQEITKKVTRRMDNPIEQFEGTLTMHELQGLDKQLRSIRDLLKVEVAKRVELQQCI